MAKKEKNKTEKKGNNENAWHANEKKEGNCKRKLQQQQQQLKQQQQQFTNNDNVHP